MHRPLFAIAFLLASAASAAPPTSGIDLAGIDSATRPGDDFEQFANGAWCANAVINPDRSAAGVGLVVTKLAEQRLATLIAGAVAARPLPGTSQRRIADYYAACNDTAAIEARGLAPIQPVLAEIAALKDKKALSAMLGANVRADIDPLNNTGLSTDNLFGLFVTQDLANPNRTLPYLMQGGLGLPDRDYYFSPAPEMAKPRTAYEAYAAQIFTLAGYDNARLRGALAYLLDMRIAAAHADIIASQDPHKTAAWTRADFATKAPGIDWAAFFAGAGACRPEGFHSLAAWRRCWLVKLVADVPRREGLADVPHHQPFRVDAAQGV